MGRDADGGRFRQSAAIRRTESQGGAVEIFSIESAERDGKFSSAHQSVSLALSGTADSSKSALSPVLSSVRREGAEAIEGYEA